MPEQRSLVLKHLVQTPIQRIFLHQRIILTQQIPHRAFLKPQPVQSPLTARLDQPIADKRLQNVTPAGALARIK
jgi:hypothetical protein